MLAEEMAVDAARLPAIVGAGSWKGTGGLRAGRGARRRHARLLGGAPRACSGSSTWPPRRATSASARSAPGSLAELTDALADGLRRLPGRGAAPAATSTRGPSPAPLVAMLAHVAQHRYGFEFWGIKTADVRDADGPAGLLGRSPARNLPAERSGSHRIGTVLGDMALPMSLRRPTTTDPPRRPRPRLQPARPRRLPRPPTGARRGGGRSSGATALHRLAADDCAALGLRTVLDLRTEHEITERGRARGRRRRTGTTCPCSAPRGSPSGRPTASTPERFLADRYLVDARRGRRRPGAGPPRAGRPERRAGGVPLRRRQGPHRRARRARALVSSASTTTPSPPTTACRGSAWTGWSSGSGRPTPSGSTPWPTSPRRSSTRPTGAMHAVPRRPARSATARSRATRRRSVPAPDVVEALRANLLQ